MVATAELVAARRGAGRARSHRPSSRAARSGDGGAPAPPARHRDRPRRRHGRSHRELALARTRPAIGFSATTPAWRLDSATRRATRERWPCSAARRPMVSAARVCRPRSRTSTTSPPACAATTCGCSRQTRIGAVVLIPVTRRDAIAEGPSPQPAIDNALCVLPVQRSPLAEQQPALLEYPAVAGRTGSGREGRA